MCAGYPSLSLWDKLSLKDACVLCGTYYNVLKNLSLSTRTLLARATDQF